MVACDGWCHVVLFIRGHVLERALKEPERGLGYVRIEADEPALRHLAKLSDGDARQSPELTGNRSADHPTRPQWRGASSFQDWPLRLPQIRLTLVGHATLPHRCACS